MKLFVTGGIGLAGHEFAAIIEEDTLEIANEIAYHLSIENAEMYGFYQDEDFFATLDEVGREWDEELEEYEEVGEVEHEVTRYVPEVHDELI